MYSRERAAAISAARPLRSSLEFALRTISAPQAAVRSTFTGAAFSGITIVAGTPWSEAAAATPCAWLPLESATTPRAIRSAGVEASALKAPRNLNDPVRCRLSGLTKTSPSSGRRKSGVRTATPSSRARGSLDVAE